MHNTSCEMTYKGFLAITQSSAESFRTRDLPSSTVFRCSPDRSVGAFSRNELYKKAKNKAGGCNDHLGRQGVHEAESQVLIHFQDKAGCGNSTHQTGDYDDDWPHELHGQGRDDQTNQSAEEKLDIP